MVAKRVYDVSQITQRQGAILQNTCTVSNTGVTTLNLTFFEKLLEDLLSST